MMTSIVCLSSNKSQVTTTQNARIIKYGLLHIKQLKLYTPSSLFCLISSSISENPLECLINEHNENIQSYQSNSFFEAHLRTKLKLDVRMNGILIPLRSCKEVINKLFNNDFFNLKMISARSKYHLYFSKVIRKIIYSKFLLLFMIPE